MSRCRIKFCLCLFTCSGRIRFLGFSIAFYHCILIFFFNELLNCLPHVASCLQVGGRRGECDRVVYFYYIVVRLPQLAEKVCNFILNSLPPFPLLSLAKFAAQVQHTHTQTYTENLLAHRLIRQELWQHTLRLTFKLPLMRSLFLTRRSLTPSQLAANHGNYSSSRRVCHFLPFPFPVPYSAATL